MYSPTRVRASLTGHRARGLRQAGGPLFESVPIAARHRRLELAGIEHGVAGLDKAFRFRPVHVLDRYAIRPCHGRSNLAHAQVVRTAEIVRAVARTGRHAGRGDEMAEILDVDHRPPLAPIAVDTNWPAL